MSMITSLLVVVWLDVSLLIAFQKTARRFWFSRLVTPTTRTCSFVSQLESFVSSEANMTGNSKLVVKRPAMVEMFSFREERLVESMILEEMHPIWANP